MPILLELYRISVQRNCDVLEPGAGRAALFARRASEVATELAKSNVPAPSTAAVFNGTVAAGATQVDGVKGASLFLWSEGLAVGLGGFSDADDDGGGDVEEEEGGGETGPGTGAVACFDEWRMHWVTRNSEFTVSLFDAARRTFSLLAQQLGAERFTRNVAETLPPGLRRDLLS